MNVSEKYVAVKDFSKAWKIFESIIRKIIYDRLQKKKTIEKKIMMRIKFARWTIEKIYKQSWTTIIATNKWFKKSKNIWLKINKAFLQSHKFLAQENLFLIQKVKVLRGENAVLKNVINDFMTNTLIAPQDLIESKLKFVEDQFILRHDDAEHFAENHLAKNLTENLTENLTKNIAENFERDHLDDVNILLEEWDLMAGTSGYDTSEINSEGESVL